MAGGPWLKWRKAGGHKGRMFAVRIAAVKCRWKAGMGAARKMGKNLPGGPRKARPGDTAPRAASGGRGPMACCRAIFGQEPP